MLKMDKTASDDEFFECETNQDVTETSDQTQINIETEKPGIIQTDEEKEAEYEDVGDVSDITEKIEKTCLDEETEESLTEEEKEDLRKESMALKNEGNDEFKQKNLTEACNLYTKGLQRCPKCFAQERSVLFSNRAACYKNMDKTDQAIKDCSEAIELNPSYVKALLRRAQLYEETEKLDEAFADYKTVLEKDPSIPQAREACMVNLIVPLLVQRLPQQIEQRNEKMKAEMMGKLKELGNMVLKPFGLSTNNFQMQQNPETGSYNVQFVQNQQPK